jgi:biopolymer transport protein ExbD
MARPKIPRKSTIVDMTAMCDVAFLLLSFFILTTKFKAPEAVEISTPTSVSSKPAPEKNTIIISINREGKVYLAVSDDSKDKLKEMLTSLNASRGLGLSETDLERAKTIPFIGTPFSQLKSFLQIPKDKMKGDVFPGIPAKDSTVNEMTDWMGAVATVYQGQKPDLILKGDLNSKYPAFKNVIDAFKKNNILKFKMVTNPEGVPEGSDLWKKNKAGTTEENS